MIRLIHGDCLQVMDALIQEGIRVDAIITDPPYGTVRCQWDVIIPFDQMWSRINKLIKPRGVVVLFGNQPFTSLLITSNLKDFRYTWVWEKSLKTNFLSAKFQPLRKFEDIIVFYKEVGTYNPQGVKKVRREIKQGDRESDNYGTIRREESYVSDTQGYPDNIIRSRSPCFTNKYHPTQKPVALMEYLVKTYTNIKELVLDFTCGSGSTGLACKNIGRDFIGIEKDEKFFTIAKERLSK